MKMRSVMKHQFSQIPRAQIPRSHFNRGHGYKTTFDGGYLVPIYIDEVLPGDTFNLRATLFARLSTPIVPIMDNLFLDTFYFFVPIRLLWENWQKFNGEQENPGDSTDYLVPELQAPAGGWQPLSLSDYFGLPTGVSNIAVAAFWHRAYNLIYNEWFRRQDLQDSVPVNKGDGPDNDADYKLLRRTKRHDYFTSCLPWPQKGPGVEIPIGGNAPITGIGQVTGGSVNVSATGPFLLGSRPFQAVDYSPGSNQYEWRSTGTSAANAQYTSGLQGTIVSAQVQPGTMFVDLSQAQPVSINSFRQAFQIQKLLERDARGGTRYTEILRAHFGVVSPDARLQRPEYLGGSSARINIQPVPQTGPSTTTSPQGNLAAYGLVADSRGGFVKSFVEHGVILGIANVRADLTYQQGIPRMFNRRTRWDFYWPAFAHLGEQAVLNKEIYAQGTTVDDDVFGYQERFAEYRYAESKITGKFRSQDPQSLDVWHLSQEFENLPQLTPEFIEDDPPIDRVIAVPAEPHMILDSYFDVQCARPMPVYSVPGLVDHF